VPATTAPATAAPTPARPFTLRSGAFASGGAIPSQYTCDGADISPDLSWTGTPDGTNALVLVVDDPDAGGFAHWLVLDMPPDRASLARGAGKAGGSPQQGTNDFGAAAWGGPCPPSGDHRYRFTLYALAAPMGLRGAPARGPVHEALGKSKVLGRAVLTAHYRRGG
jgi:Raf kinase inhibitor-like YbhB/YbcL family protein